MASKKRTGLDALNEYEAQSGRRTQSENQQTGGNTGTWKSGLDLLREYEANGGGQNVQNGPYNPDYRTKTKAMAQTQYEAAYESYKKAMDTLDHDQQSGYRRTQQERQKQLLGSINHDQMSGYRRTQQEQSRQQQRKTQTGTAAQRAADSLGQDYSRLIGLNQFDGELERRAAEWQQKEQQRQSALTLDQTRGQQRTAYELGKQIEQLETELNDNRFRQMRMDEGGSLYYLDENGRRVEARSTEELNREIEALQTKKSKLDKSLTGRVGEYAGDLATGIVSGGADMALGGIASVLDYLEQGANGAAAWALRDLAKAVPDGGLKNKMLSLANDFESYWTGESTTEHEKTAQYYSEELQKLNAELENNYKGPALWVQQQMPSMGNMLFGAGVSGVLGINNLITLGVTAGGNAAQEAKSKGATDVQALAYGVVAGGLEAFSERLFGGNPIYDKDAGLVNKAVGKLTDNKTILRILNSKAFDIASEGLEEVVTEILDPVAEWAIYNGSNTEFADAESIGNAFLGGVFLSVVGNIADAPAHLRQARYERTMNAAATELADVAQSVDSADVQEAVQVIRDKIAYGVTPDAADIGAVLDAMSKEGEAVDTQTVQAAVERAEAQAETEKQEAVFQQYNAAMDAQDAAQRNAERIARARSEEVTEAINGSEAESAQAASDTLMEQEAKDAQTARGRLAAEEARTDAAFDSAAQEADVQALRDAARQYGFDDHMTSVLLSGYDGAQDAQQYAEAVNAAYEYGRNGMSLTAAQRAAQGVNADVVQEAWNAGNAAIQRTPMSAFELYNQYADERDARQAARETTQQAPVQAVPETVRQELTPEQAAQAVTQEAREAAPKAQETVRETAQEQTRPAQEQAEEKPAKKEEQEHKPQALTENQYAARKMAERAIKDDDVSVPTAVEDYTQKLTEAVEENQRLAAEEGDEGRGESEVSYMIAHFKYGFRGIAFISTAKNNADFIADAKAWMIGNAVRKGNYERLDAAKAFDGLGIEERTLRYAAAAWGYSDSLAQRMVREYNAQDDASAAEYAQHVRSVFDRGAMGESYASAKDTLLGESMSRAAWNAGKGFGNGEETGSTAAGDGGKRDAGMDPGEPSGAVAGRAGGTAEKHAGAARVKERTKLENRVRASGAQYLNGKDIGLPKGSERRSFREAAESTWTDEMKTAAQTLRSAGFSDVHFTVGAISIENQKAKVTRYADGAAIGDTVWVNATATKWTVTQLANHEAFHRQVQDAPYMLESVRAALADELGEDGIAELAQRYAEAYEGCYGAEDIDAYVEEICADAYAGMDRLPEAKTEIMQKAARQAQDAQRTEEKYSIAGVAEQDNTRDQTQDEITKHYKTDVHGILSGSSTQKGALLVGYTPEIYRKLGMPDLPFVVGSGHVYSMAKTATEASADGKFQKGTNYHGLGESVVSDIMDFVRDPVMVIAAKDINAKASPMRSTHSVVALIDVGDHGNALVIPVSITAERSVDGVRMDVNAISSAYEKNVSALVNEAVAQFNTGDNSVFYVKREAADLLGAGVQFPEQLKVAASSDGIVRKFDSKINMSVKNVTQSQQFKRWFGDWQNHPETASKVVNADGTPKVVYHQTGNDFTIFDVRKNGAGTRDNETPFGIFLKSSSRDIGLNGKKQMALYANIRNPLYARDRADLTRQLRELSLEYDTIRQEHAALDKEYKQKFEDAKRNFINFLTEWKKNHPGESSRTLYGTPEFERVFDAEDSVVEEWTSKADTLSVRAKEVLTDALKQAGYDGVFLANDAGSWGRSTDAYIALSENQVKSATDNVGTFDRDNPDIRYSAAEDAGADEAADAGTQELLAETLPQANRDQFMRFATKITDDLVTPLTADMETLRKEMRPRVLELVDEFLQDGALKKSSVNALFEEAYDRALELNREFSEKYATLQYTIRKTPVTFTEEDTRKIEQYDYFDDAALRKLTIKEKGGASIGELYSDLSGMLPELFPSGITNPAKQVMRIASVYKRISKAQALAQQVDSTNPEYFRENARIEFLEDLRTIVPKMRTERELAQIAVEENAQMERAAAERARRIAEEDARIAAEEAAKEPAAVYESLTMDSMPKKAQDYLKRVQGRTAAAIQSTLSMPFAARQEVLKPALGQMMNEYLQTGHITQETIDKTFEESYAKGVELDTEFYDQYKDVKTRLRDLKVTLSEADRADIADFDDFRRAAFGRLRIANEGGIPVDTAYQTMREMAQELFPASITHPADQLMKMFEVSKRIQKVERSLDEAHGENAEEFKRWAKNDYEASVEGMLGSLRTARRYAEARMRQKQARAVPTTQEEVTALWKELKKLRRTYERASAKNLMTAEDNAVLNRLLRGELAPEDVQGMENADGILVMYEAKADYDAAAAKIADWQRYRKSRLLDEADSLLQNAEQAKDKPNGFLYARETMTRNVRDIFPEADAAAINRTYFEPVRRANADANKMKNRLREQVAALNLSRKAAKGDAVSEAHAVQLLGEAQDNIRYLEKNPRVQDRDGKTLDEWRGIVQELWKTSPGLDKAKIESAVESFRKIYDGLFEQMNEVRIRNGYEPINYRQGYFPHFQPGTSDGILSLMGKALGIDAEVTALPTTISGLTHTFKPGITYFGHALERVGFNTAYDAVEGFDKYVEGAASVIYYTDAIQKLRALAQQVRYRTSDEGLRERVDAVREMENISEQDKENRIKEIMEKGRYSLSNFAQELDEYTNLLANKKSKHDRSIESMAGRKVYNLMKAWENRVAANMVAVNPTSWLTNFGVITQAGAQLKTTSVLKAMAQTLKGWKTDDGFVDRSDFLTNRRGSDPLVRSLQQNVSATLSKPMDWIDTFSADTIVRARYMENVERGMSAEDAVHEADDFAANVMAERAKGAMPTLFESRNPIFKMFTQFQLEVNNTFSYLFKDLPQEQRKKGAGALALALFKFLIGGYLYNEVYEHFIGRRPMLDPLGIVNDTVGDLTGYELNNLLDAATGDGLIKESEPEGVIGSAENLTGNLGQELPFIGNVMGGGKLPFASSLPDVGNIASAMKSETATTEEKLAKIGKEMANPAAYWLLPFGGGQVKKMWQGIQALKNQGSYTADGRLQYPIYSDRKGDKTGALARTLLFGKSATPEAQAWVEAGFGALSEKATATYEAMRDAGVDQRDSYELIKAMSKVKKTDDATAEQLKMQVLRAFDIEDSGKVLYYYNMMASDKEKSEIERLLAEGADMGEYLRFLDQAAGVTGEKDEDGKTISGSKKQETLELIDGLDMTPEQKTELAENRNYKTTGFEPWTENHDKLYNAVSSGKDLRKTLQSLKKDGYEDEDLRAAITDLFKEEYLAADRTGRARLKGYLRNAFTECGLSKKQAENKIDKWTEAKK